MKAISKQAQKVMDVLTANIGEAEGEVISRKIDNTNGVFMPVHVEFLKTCALGRIFSVAYYFKQNEDFIRVPDMVFIKGEDGKYYPISFWHDAPLIRDEAVEWEGDKIKGVQTKLQAKLVTLANKWLKNIKGQQGL